MSATDARVMAAHAEVKAEIARTDSKTALLLAFVGAVLAGVWSAGRDLPLTAAVLVPGVGGMVAFVAAAGLLLASVRPNLSGRHGFPLWATLTPDRIRTAVATDMAADVAGLARIAVAKFTALRRAVDLVRLGGALLVVAVVVAALGGAA